MWSCLPCIANELNNYDECHKASTLSHLTLVWEADWPRLEIDHNLPYAKKNKTINDILNFIDKGSGFYSYFDGEKCLYFGIGSKSISKRLKDHYFETHSTKMPSRGALWNEFFSKYKKPLTIRYFSFRGHKDDLIDKKVLELLEAIILKENNIEFENFRANKKKNNKND